MSLADKVTAVIGKAPIFAAALLVAPVGAKAEQPYNLQVRDYCGQGAGIFRHRESGNVLTLYSAESRWKTDLDGALILYGMFRGRTVAFQFVTGSNASVFASIQEAHAIGPNVRDVTHEDDTYRLFIVRTGTRDLPRGTYDWIGCR